jgi:hypothetical protein
MLEVPIVIVHYNILNIRGDVLLRFVRRTSAARMKSLWSTIALGMGAGR